MDLLLRDEDAFLDLGANWGYMSLHAALRQGFAGRVIAVEPAASPRADLTRLIAECSIQGRIEESSFAIGDRDGATILSRPMWSGQATVVEPETGEPVEIRRIDSLDLPAVRLIKIDIEGSETAFVRGASRYIQAHRPAIVFENRLDTPGGDWAGPFALLGEHGYSFFGLSSSIETGHDQASRINLELLPVDQGRRLELPLHLNVLAVAETDVLTSAPYRITTTANMDRGPGGLAQALIETKPEETRPMALPPHCENVDDAASVDRSHRALRPHRPGGYRG